MKSEESFWRRMFEGGCFLKWRVKNQRSLAEGKSNEEWRIPSFGSMEKAACKASEPIAQNYNSCNSLARVALVYYAMDGKGILPEAGECQSSRGLPGSVIIRLQQQFCMVCFQLLWCLRRNSPAAPENFGRNAFPCGQRPGLRARASAACRRWWGIHGVGFPSLSFTVWHL